MKLLAVIVPPGTDYEPAVLRLRVSVLKTSQGQTLSNSTGHRVEDTVLTAMTGDMGKETEPVNVYHNLRVCMIGVLQCILV